MVTTYVIVYHSIMWTTDYYYYFFIANLHVHALCSVIYLRILNSEPNLRLYSARYQNVTKDNLLLMVFGRYFNVKHVPEWGMYYYSYIDVMNLVFFLKSPGKKLYLYYTPKTYTKKLKILNQLWHYTPNITLQLN